MNVPWPRGHHHQQQQHNRKRRRNLSLESWNCAAESLAREANSLPAAASPGCMVKPSSMDASQGLENGCCPPAERGGLLVFIVFLFQMRLSGMWPTQLVCDRRLIQKYVAEAVEMEESLSQCEELPLLLEPVHLPLVGLNLRVWKTKTNEVKTQEILQALIQLVDGIALAQQSINETCLLLRLQQLHDKASFFVLHLRNFQGQEQSVTTLPENVPKLISTRNLRTVFWTYVKLLQGKLNFLFYDLRKDSCAEGRQPAVAFPP